MNGILEKVQDKFVEKLLNKIVDSKKVVITIDFQDKKEG